MTTLVSAMSRANSDDRTSFVAREISTQPYDDWKTDAPDMPPAANGQCRECGAPCGEFYLCLECEQRRDDAFERFEDERHEDWSAA